MSLSCSRAGKSQACKQNYLVPNPLTRLDCKARVNGTIFEDGKCKINSVILEHNHYLECVLHHLPKKNFIYDSLLYWKQNYHKKFIKKYVDYFITPSERLSEMITHEFRKPGDTLPNPVLINTESVEIIDGEYLLYVGRLDPEKGVLTLLKAFQKVLVNFPEEKLIIVGSGSIQHLLELYVKENNLTNVLFLGVKNKSNLKELYASAKFTIVPSEFLESYGNVILESFAFKKAVIISDLLGLKNEVVENNCGLVFPYGNVDELQESIENLLTDTVLRKRFETNAAQYV
ncbi:MAG: glycosyltransferase, partial [Flavobacterium sp.]